MNDNFKPIDSLVGEIKGNINFLERLLFPNVKIILGIFFLMIIFAVKLFIN
jgi:hypothetical protein